MKLPAISTILKEASEIKGRKNKIDFLRSHHPNQTMLTLLKYAYDPAIRFDLPSGEPPYKPCDYLDQQARLYQEARKLYTFLDTDTRNIPRLKKETLFIQVLESIDKEDAKLLVAIKDKKIPYKGITEKLVREAFPNLLSEKV